MAPQSCFRPSSTALTTEETKLVEPSDTNKDGPIPHLTSAILLILI